MTQAIHISNSTAAPDDCRARPALPPMQHQTDRLGRSPQQRLQHQQQQRRVDAEDAIWASYPPCDL